MRPYFCSWQDEIAAALHEGTLPDALREHTNACRQCADLVLVTEAFQQERALATQATSSHTRAQSLATPSLLWWRAQLRQRNQALERVTRPIFLAEKIALIGVVLSAVGLILWQGDWMTSLLNSLVDSFSDPANAALSSTTANWMILSLIAGFGSLVAFSGLAVYLIRKKK